MPGLAILVTRAYAKLGLKTGSRHVRVRQKLYSERERYCSAAEAHFAELQLDQALAGSTQELHQPNRSWDQCHDILLRRHAQ